MWGAVLWGAISGSAVLLGALSALYLKIPKKVIGFIMAFGTGVLIGAATFELLGDAMVKGGLEPTIIGFLAGALVFTLFDWVIARKGGANRKRSGKNSPPKEEQNKKGGLGIFIGTIMDAIPESIMIGASLVAGKGVSLVLVIAIFISNIPEGLAGTVGMQRSGTSKIKIFVLWVSVLLISTLASLSGYIFLDNSSQFVTALISTFAAGGIVSMVASTMMPEAYEEGGSLIGLVSALGLLTSLVLDQL